MKVHLKQIPSQGLHLSGEDDCPIQELASEEMQCAGPLHYDIDVGVGDDQWWADAEGVGVETAFADDQTAILRALQQADGDAGGWLFGDRVADELDGDEQPLATDIADDGVLFLQPAQLVL